MLVALSLTTALAVAPPAPAKTTPATTTPATTTPATTTPATTTPATTTTSTTTPATTTPATTTPATTTPSTTTPGTTTPATTTPATTTPATTTPGTTTPATTTPATTTTATTTPSQLPLAVLPLRATDLQLNEANRLDVLLRARASTIGGYRVQSADETTTLLEAAQDLGVTCEVGVPVCGAEIGRVAAVERVLVGRAARVADIAAQGEAAAVAGGIGLDVALVESASGAVLRRVHALLPAAPAAQVKALDDVARALFVDGVTSTLTVRGTPAGAEIVVDGLAAGALPAAGAAPAVVDGVLPGAHVVSVRQRGYLPLVTTSTVTAEGGAVVDAVLVVDPDAEREVVSPLQVGVAFGTAGVGALMLAAGTTIGVLASQSFFAVAEANAAIDAADPTRAGYPATVRDLHAQASSAQADWTNGGYATTVGGIVVAGVGVVAAVGGAVWGTLLLSSSENEPTSSPPSSPSPSTTRSGT